MLIECKLRRPTGTIVDFGNATYHFRPATGARNEPHVAEVMDHAHIQAFLAIPEAYAISAGEQIPVAPDEVLDVLAGEYLTFAVTKDGQVPMQVVTALGLVLTYQGLANPADAEKPAPEAAPTPRSVIPAADPAAPASVAPVTEPAVSPYDSMSDEDLAIAVKTAVGRAPKPGTTREAMLAALNAALAAKAQA